MKLAECELQSVSPYQQSRYYHVDPLPKELAEDYEKRTWRERCHVNPDGNVIIPPMAFANSLKEAAQFLSLPIPGKARQTFTKHFDAGTMVADPVVLPIKKEDVQPLWLFVPSDGKRGGGRRVMKCFPVIPSWSGKVMYYILDDIITQDAFRQILETSGSLIGIGAFRPRNRGYFGRFKVLKITWVDR